MANTSAGAGKVKTEVERLLFQKTRKHSKIVGISPKYKSSLNVFP